MVDLQKINKCLSGSTVGNSITRATCKDIVRRVEVFEFNSIALIE